MLTIRETVFRSSVSAARKHSVIQLNTRIRSTVMRALSSAGFMELLRRKARAKRRFSGEPPAVLYFHQVDDPYSHLAVQKLDQLKAAYDVPFRTHLVSHPGAAYEGSSQHFDAWALRDALSVAPDYDVTLRATQTPGAAEIQAANDILAPHLGQPDFTEAAVDVGETLWGGELRSSEANTQTGGRAVREGDALRQKLGHYLGGMFHFEGEWFWGLDRVRLLEQRLVDEGFGTGRAELCVPEPTPIDTSGLNASHVVVEYFPSLRSPYTAIGHRRVLDLLARSGATLKLRPVMPMMMRGVPAPAAKQRYIIADSGREARSGGVLFGRIVDPFGEPIKRAFALFAGAVALGKGTDFVTAYLSAAWAEGVDITGETGLRQVAAEAGIEWSQLQCAAEGADWETVLDENLNDMLAAGLWGVPSFRVTGGRDASAFACWGQDRIWRVENEIGKRA